MSKVARVHQTSADLAILHPSTFIQTPISFDLYPRKSLGKVGQVPFFRHFCRFEVGQLGQLQTCSCFIFGRAKFRPSHLFRSVSKSQASVASSRPDKQSGNTKNFEQKLTKVTKEFRMKHSPQAVRTVLTAPSLDAILFPS